MDVIAQQIRQFSPVLYIACAIGFITFAFVGITSLRDYRKAVFRMERSSVGARVTGAWVRAVMCAIVGLGIYFITTATSPVSVSSRRSIAATIAPTPTKPGLILPTSLPTADYSNPNPVITPTFVIGNQDATPVVALVSDVVTTDVTLSDTAIVPSPAPEPTLQSPVITVAPEATTAAQSTAIQTAVAQNAPAVAAAGMTLPTSTTIPRTPTRAPTTVATSAAIFPSNTPASVPTIVPLQSAATAIPTAAPAAAAPAADSGLLPPDCGDPGTVGISSPGQGETISSKRAVTGNAGFPNDGSYAKLEIMPQEGGGWRFLGKIDVGVREGQLGAIDPAYFAPGPYFLRLLIVDKDGHEIRICRVSVRVAG